jgi:hypothetical protein
MTMTMMMIATKRPSVAFLASVLLVTAAVPAHAQDTVTDIIGFLMTNQAVGTADIERDRNAAETARETITRALLVNLTAVPIATSSSGFLYRLSPELGTVERATESFGGFFVERALTPGHGRASFGISATTSSFDRLDGLNLRDGSLLTISARFIDEAEPFDTEWLTLRVRSSTMTVLGSVGIGDRLEIGGAMPFVRLTLEGERINVYRGDTNLQASGFAEASGIADAALRAKYTLAATREAGLAIAGELRLPTGDADNLLGAGSTSVRVTGIGAVEHGPWTMTGNAGFARGGISNELLFGGAAALALHPRVTLAGELMARRISELGAIQLSATPHPKVDKVETLRLIGGEGGRTISAGILGLKWNPSGTLVLAANVRWSFTTTGLTAPFTPSIAFEYAF